MSKVLTFSRVFPKYHPKAGQKTLFVEKFWNSFSVHVKDQEFYVEFENDLTSLNKTLPFHLLCNFKLNLEGRYNIGSKHHTIRAGHRWKKGDYFSPRVWSGKPYNSPQITIGPDTLITDVWDFEIDLNCVYSINGKYTSEQTDYDLATNDGLTESDMQFWFMPNMDKPKEFKGQIICWNDKIKY